MNMEDVTQVVDEMQDEEAEFIRSEDIDGVYDIDYENAPSDDDDDVDVDENDADENDDADDDGFHQVEDDIPNQADVTFTGHENPVYAVAISPVDSNLILSGGGDDKGILWNRNTGEIIHKLEGHSDSIVAVGFSFDGVLAATGGYDGIVAIWSVADGSLQRKLEGPSEEIEWLSWHKKGHVILAGSSDGTTWMWLATTGDCMQVFSGHEEGVTCGGFTGSGKLAVTGSNDCTLRIWNPAAGNTFHCFKGSGFHEAPICTVVCHPSGPLMISGSQDGTARLIHIPNKKVLAVLDHRVGDHDATKYSVECAGFSTTNNWCATAGLDGNMRIWDLGNFQCRHICRHNDGVTKLLWHPTKPFVFTASVDGRLRVWDARNGECVRTFTGHQDMILDISLVVDPSNSDSSVIATASDDGTSRIFKLEF